MSTQSILPLIYKQKLARILDQMKDAGESEADMRTYARGFKAETIANIKSQHETNRAAELAAQPAFTGIGGDINPNADWSRFLPGMWQGAVHDFPHGLAEMGGHALQAAGGNVFAGGNLLKDIWGATGGLVTKGIPELIGGGTPEDVGRFGGQVGAGAAVGGLIKGASKISRSEPHVALTKAKGYIINAYQGLLKAGTPDTPSSLDYALPHIMEEAQGKPFIDLHHLKTLVDDAHSKYSGMMRDLEDQFRSVPLQLDDVKNAILSEIPSITNAATASKITKWAMDRFTGMSNLGDFLTKRAEFNKKISTFEAKEKIGKAQAMGQPNTAADVNAVNKIREIIDDTINQHAGGNINAPAMYQVEAALKDVKDAGDTAVQANEQMKAERAGKRLGTMPTAEAAGLVAGHRTPYSIYRAAREVSRPIMSSANMPDALVAKAGKLLQKGSLFKQPGAGAVQSPMSWHQNSPNPQVGPTPNLPSPPTGPMQGTPVNPPAQGGSPTPFVGRAVNPPPQPMGGGTMPNLVRVGPGHWVTQDVLDAGTPPGQVGAGRVLGLPAQSLSTASDMELNQAAINTPKRKVGKPPRSTWRMKETRPPEMQPREGELDITAKPETVETKPYEVIDKRTQFTAPPENPTAPSRMQEQPINREDIISNRSQREGLDEPIVEKAPDWPGIGSGYHIKWSDMETPTTVYVKPGEDLSAKIEQFKSQFPRQ